VDVLAVSRQMRVYHSSGSERLCYLGIGGIAGGVAVLSHPSRAGGIACDPVVAGVVLHD
jgi:hypothetical protein